MDKIMNKEDFERKKLLLVINDPNRLELLWEGNLTKI